MMQMMFQKAEREIRIAIGVHLYANIRYQGYPIETCQAAFRLPRLYSYSDPKRLDPDAALFAKGFSNFIRVEEYALR